MGTIRNSNDVAKLVRSRMAELEEEELAVITTDGANNVIKEHYTVTKGDNRSTVISVKQIARLAVLDYASGVILIHNHPSGNTKPSQADIKETERVKRGLNTLDICLMDHVIVGKNDYYSFTDNGVNTY